MESKETVKLIGIIAAIILFGIIASNFYPNRYTVKYQVYCLETDGSYTIKEEKEKIFYLFNDSVTKTALTEKIYEEETNVFDIDSLEIIKIRKNHDIVYQKFYL